MTEQRTRLRINLAQREFEVEGSEAFVNRYVERLDQLLERLSDGPKPEPARPSSRPLVGVAEPQTFGELLEQQYAKWQLARSSARNCAISKSFPRLSGRSRNGSRARNV